MSLLLKAIDINNKMSAEQHIALYLFDKYQNNNNINYDQLNFTQALINSYNYYIRNPINREQFKNFLFKYNDCITDFINRFNSEPWNYVKPIIWNDRNKSNYYIENLTLSHRFEIYIESLLAQRNISLGLFYSKDEQYNQGESSLGIEIKRDIRSFNTGNIFIEYAERLNPNGQWVPSGIFKKDNTKYFLIGDIERFHIIKKQDLIQIFNAIENGEVDSIPKGIMLKEAQKGTGLGFIIPLEAADQISLTFDQLVRELSN